MRVLLQNATVLLKNVTVITDRDDVITKRDSCYKMRHLLQTVKVQTTSTLISISNTTIKFFDYS